jgi:NitT/TauT family transport system ATP-binding protein
MSGRERLVLDRVSKIYRDGPNAIATIDDFSLSVCEGDFVTIIGPSGCGKTTLLNIVAGFVMPTSGTVLLDGAPIIRPGPDRGMVFQEYGVFPWLSVKENIAFGLRLEANRAHRRDLDDTCRRYLELMGLSAFRDAYPKNLSGGMRQRVAIARAYAVNPQFLLMDEPFGALDAQTRSAMQELLIDLQTREGKTTLFVTHSVEEALYLSTRVIAVSARPTHIRRVVDVPFPYPRTPPLRHTPEFQSLVAELTTLVMSEYAAQQRQVTVGGINR